MLDNPLVRAIILGIVQGVTEFLPVSSSGHLVVVPYLMSWEPAGLAFDTALHLGTLVATVAYFWGDVWYLATRTFGIGTVVEGEAARARRTIGLLALGSVPAAAVGFFLEGLFEEAFEQPAWVAGFLLGTALLLWSAERLRRRRARAVGIDDPGPTDDPGRDETTVGYLDSIVIGSFQALSLFPGISRSGSTIAAGMYRGMSRAASARFSFLLMIPAVAGATILQVPEAFGTEQVYPTHAIIAGMIASAVSGYWAVRYLLRLVQTDDLVGFARYVVLLSLLVFIGLQWIGPPSQI